METDSSILQLQEIERLIVEIASHSSTPSAYPAGLPFQLFFPQVLLQSLACTVYFYQLSHQQLLITVDDKKIWSTDGFTKLVLRLLLLLISNYLRDQGTQNVERI